MLKVYNKCPELAPKYVHEIRNFAYNNNTIHTVQVRNCYYVYIGIYKYVILLC